MYSPQALDIPGAFLLPLPSFPDERGVFVKTFQDTVWRQAGIHFRLKESYFSFSEKDVIRGMHFQVPPHQHSKIVFCPRGAITDVIVDLRRDSPAYKKFIAVTLSEASPQAIYIPEGCAHGFHALQAGSMTYYLVSSEYSKEHDSGIRYDSFGYDWNVARPVLSGRDLSFPQLKDFDTPF